MRNGITKFIRTYPFRNYSLLLAVCLAHGNVYAQDEFFEADHMIVAQESEAMDEAIQILADQSLQETLTSDELPEARFLEIKAEKNLKLIGRGIRNKTGDTILLVCVGERILESHERTC